VFLIKNLAKRMIGIHLKPYQIEVNRKNGGKLFFEVNAGKIEYQGKEADLVIFRNITERIKMEKKLKEYSLHLEEMVAEKTEELKKYAEHLEDLVEEKTKELKEAQRMAGIGEATAIVGHDLRNPLQAIVNVTYLMKMMAEAAPPEIMDFFRKEGYLEMIQSISDDIYYMNKVVSDLNNYARALNPKCVPIDLEQLIKETFQLINVPDNIKASTLIQESLPKLMVDPLMIKRAISNLILNAVQAMPEGGSLTIQASKVGRMVLVKIQDTGVGIPKDNFDKIFQPLYTTKAQGQGLGLPVAKRIVEAHNGTIEFESQKNKGATFTITLPIEKSRYA
jgi:signal transduction histidine kinase